MMIVQRVSSVLRHRVGNLRSWRPLASPLQDFIADRIYNAPGNRLSTFVIWRAWQRHCEAKKINPGTSADLIAAVRAEYPDARMVLGKSGRDARPGKRHFTGIALR